MIFRIFDFTTMALILVCIFVKFKYRWTWVIYLYGCVVYTVINIFRDIPGQAIMNGIAACLALWNIVTFRREK